MLYDSTGGGWSAIASDTLALHAGRRSLWDNFSMEKVIAPIVPGRSAATVTQAHRTAPLAVALFALYITLDWLTAHIMEKMGVRSVIDIVRMGEILAE